jgi:hypothetical protein
MGHSPFQREFDNDGSYFLRTYTGLLKLFRSEFDLFPLLFIEDMRAKRVIKNNNISHLKGDKIDGPALQNYHERKERRIAHHTIMQLNGPFANREDDGCQTCDHIELRSARPYRRISAA